MSSSVQELFKFSPASGFWASLRVLASLVYGVATVFTLPVHLLLHRRIGERYLNPILVIASCILWTMMLLSIQPPLTYAIQNRLDKTWIPLDAYNTLVVLQFRFIVFGIPILFVLHRYACWRRDRANDIVHSKSWGVPTYLLPRRVIANASDDIAPPSPPAAPPQHIFDELDREWTGAWHQMVADYKANRVPSGIIPWFVATVIQPVVLLVVAVYLSVSGFGIGVLVFYASLGMFLQGRIVAAFFREQVLDHRDSRLEQEVWARIIRGEPARAEQHGYAMPIASRSVPREVKDSIAARIRAIDPSLADFLKPAAVVEGKEKGV